MMWYEKPLAMSVADICKEFREAKDALKQIDILADLNGTKTPRIAWLLDRAGYDIPANKLPRAPRTYEGVDLDRLWEGSPEAAEADMIRAASPELSAEPVKKEPVKKEPVDRITADLWRVYLGAVRDCGRAVDERDVRDMMTLRGIAERIGGGGNGNKEDT